MRNFRVLITMVFYLIFGAACGQADAFITVEGEVLKPLKLTAKHIAKFPQTEVKAKDRDGNEHIYNGTLLHVILDSAGVTLGKELRGENLTKYILIKAVDGYQVIYALPEIDPEFTTDTVLLATHVDGKPLPKGEGPFRLVNPIDKKARAVDQANNHNQNPILERLTSYPGTKFARWNKILAILPEKFAKLKSITTQCL